MGGTDSSTPFITDGDLPKEVGTITEASAELNVQVNGESFANYKDNFDNFDLKDDQLKLLEENNPRDVTLEYFTKVAFHDNRIPPKRVNEKLKYLAYEFNRFHKSFQKNAENEERMALLTTTALKEASDMVDDSEVDVDQFENFIALLQSVGVEKHFGLLRTAFLGKDVLPPGVLIKYNDINFDAVKKIGMVKRSAVPNICNATVDMLCCCFTKPIQRCREAANPSKALENVSILHDVKGVIVPGRYTLLLGPPGSGKTSFMRALTNRLQSKRNKQTFKGNVTFNDNPMKKIDMKKISTLVSQLDDHIATLTTRETLEFAYQCRFREFNDGVHDKKMVESMQKDWVEMVLILLGLLRAGDTIIGNDILKGVSGGEKRRVTLGEMLVFGSKCLFLDEISTGLDSASTFDISDMLKNMCHVFNSTITVCLLQPPPETYNLFDDVILINEGKIMYHGPREEILPYFEKLGFVKPPEIDEADFLVEVILPAGKKFLMSNGDLEEKGIKPPKDALEFKERFDASEECKKMMALGDVEVDPTNPQLSKIQGVGFFKSLMLITKRQFAVIARNKAFVMVRLFQNIIMGLLLGALMFQISFANWYLKAMLFMQYTMFVGFSSISLLTDVIKSRNIFYKQSAQAFYSEWAYIFGDFLAFLPFNLLDTVCFGSIIYFLCGLTLSDNGARYFLYLLIAISFGISMASFVRLLGYCCKDTNTAFGASILVIVIFIIFSGAIATPATIPAYWIWVYWLNPIAYAYRSFLLNEFLSDEFMAEVYNGIRINTPNGECLYACAGAEPGKTDPCQPPLPQNKCGIVFLEARQVDTNSDLLWGGIVYIWGFTLLTILIAAVGLKYLRYDETVQSLDLGSDEEAEKKKERSQLSTSHRTLKEVQMTSQLGDAKQSEVKGLTFSFKDLFYTLTLPTKEEGKSGTMELDLLKGVTGFMKPKQLVALMGSSGAGKTTLLDVLANRKTQGKMRGTILVNGKEMDPNTYQRVIGYVEQFGVHAKTATVRESLEFSARLRLPLSTSEKERQSMVNSTLQVLELEKIQGKMVGTATTGGLSFEETKRLTIGVELTANPSIVFADEPTSGLDAHAAFIVVDALKRIAESGRTVICTIHQPSRSIFELFDRLLLMKRGGEVVYFGDLGEHSSELIQYFEKYPAVKPCPDGYNPATWMLEVIGAGVETAGEAVDYAAEYVTSELCNSNIKELDEMNQKQNASEDAIVFSDDDYAGAGLQMLSLVKRNNIEYWRSPSFSLARWILIGVIALILGSVFIGQEMRNAADAQSRCTAINLIVILAGNYNINAIVPFMFSHKALFYRERASRMYKAVIYALADQVVEDPYLFVESLVMVNIFYWMVGFHPDLWRFFYYWFVSFLYVAIFTYMGVMFSALISSPGAAILLGTLSAQIFGLFAGTSVPPSQIPNWLIWLHYLSPTRWTQEGLITTQFYGVDTPICYPSGAPKQEYADGSCDVGYVNSTIGYCCPQGNNAMPVGEYVLGPLFLGGEDPPPGFQFEWRYYVIAYLLGILLIIRLIAVAGTVYVNHNKR